MSGIRLFLGLLLYVSPGTRLCLGLLVTVSGTRLFLGLNAVSGIKLRLVDVGASFSESETSLVSRDMSGIMLCLGLLLMSAIKVFRAVLSPSTGDTAMLALRPGLFAEEWGVLVCGDEAVLLEALRLREDALLCNILLPVLQFHVH